MRRLSQRETATETLRLAVRALPGADPLWIADFAIDREARQATCPQGQRSVTWSERTERDGSGAVNTSFAAAACAVCPLRAVRNGAGGAQPAPERAR